MFFYGKIVELVFDGVKTVLTNSPRKTCHVLTPAQTRIATEARIFSGKYFQLPGCNHAQHALGSCGLLAVGIINKDGFQMLYGSLVVFSFHVCLSSLE